MFAISPGVIKICAGVPISGHSNHLLKICQFFPIISAPEDAYPHSTQMRDDFLVMRAVETMHGIAVEAGVADHCSASINLISGLPLSICCNDCWA